MTRIITFLSLLLFPLGAMAQRYSVSGHVADAKDTSALIGVSVLLTNNTDTSQKNGGVTDVDGNFQMANVAPGVYSVRIDYLGYKRVSKTIAVSSADVNMGSIYMQTSANEIKGVVIKDKAIRAEQMGDTSQFRADAYKTNPDATAEDLVTKMPGVTSDNTGVKVNGESVQQVYIDGKPFFGTDPTLALKNLPAEVIDKIQVFDKLSDQAQFTGFDDGNAQKTMNIITKRNKSEGVFGKVYGGYGTDDTYSAGGNLNIFNGDQRITLLGMSNNINLQNFSSQDLLGISGGSGQNRGGSGSSRGSFGGGSGGGSSSGNFLVGQQGGITTTNSAGINYSDNWGKKIKVSGSYFYNQTDNTTSTDLVRNYFTRQDTGLVYGENDQSEAMNYNHRFNLRLEYTIDSFNSIIFTPGISFQKNNTSTSQQAYYDSAGHMISNTSNFNGALNSGYSSGNNLLIQHKFKKPRRTISLNLNSSLNEKTGSGSYSAIDSTFHYDGVRTATDTTINQRYTLYNNGYTVGGTLGYTEPVGKKGQLMVNYSPTVAKSNADKETYDNGDVPDESLSNKYNTTYITQRAGLNYRVGDKKLNFMIGANAQYATLEGERTYPTSFNLDRNFENLLPTAMLNYRFADGRNLRIMYRTNTVAPSVTQLQDVVDISNPLLLKTGNLNLKQDYEQTLIIRYGLTKAKTAKNFFVYIYGNYINDYIGNATYRVLSDSTFNMPHSSNSVLIPRGSQLTLPVNLQGYANAKGFFTYGIPVDAIKCNLNFNGGFSYTHTPGQINDQVNFSDNYVPSAGLVLSSNVSTNLDFTLSYSGNYNIVKNSIQTDANNNYYSHVAAFKINWIFLKHFVVNTNITHNYYTAFSSTGDQSYFLWNAYLGYKFLKNDALEARISAYDVLNQNKAISRTVTDLYIENSVTQVLKQYFMLQLTYTIRNFKGAMPQAPKEDDNMRPQFGRGRAR